MDKHLSKTYLNCPYSEDGKVVLRTEGGAENSSLSSWSAEHLRYTEMRQDTILVPQIDTSWSYSPKYDSTRYTVVYDTLVSGRDSIIKRDTIYEQMYDSIAGGYLYDSLQVYDTSFVKEIVEVPYEKDTMFLRLLEEEIVSSGYVKTLEPCKANLYRFVYRSSLEACPDSVYLDVIIDKPAPVKLFGQTLDVSCSSSDDGVISLKPLRGKTSLSLDSSYYAVSHSKDDPYSKNRLYYIESDSAGVTVTEKGEIEIDKLHDTYDFKSLKWSHLPVNGTDWKELSFEMPAGSDSTEQFYLNAAGDTITAPVYSNYHLEDFWIGLSGEYQQANTQTIANLAPGKYAIEVTDAKSCVYHDTFAIKLPPNVLKIDSILFDEDAAYCDPTKRQILVFASGGWGEYNFSFKDTLEEKSKGELTDGYRGGEASHYDEKNQNGWGLSQFLAPGRYIATVMDKNGCFVISDKEYDVRSKFVLKADSTSVLCPEDPLTATEIYFKGDRPSFDGNYTILEYVSPCRLDSLDDCVEMSFDTLVSSVKPSLKGDTLQFSDVMLSTKTHGLFVYEQAEGEDCGTYVEVSVIDTIPAINLSKKAIVSTSCSGTEDGKIELYIQGGTAPYEIVQNSGWAVDDTLNIFSSELHNDTLKLADAVFVYKYMTIDGLKADTFFFTAVDRNGCRSVMGDTASFDTAIIVKSPDPLSVQFVTSSICADENSVSDLTGGVLFFNRPRGGTPPYTYSYGSDGNADELLSFANAPIDVMGTKETVFKLVFSDANGCSLDTLMGFQQEGVDVEDSSIVFWASTWRNKSDIIALIDICAPDSLLDSVSYTFDDDRIELLDKRMYIYDIENGLDMYKEPLNGIDTKTLVPDSYFKNHFNLMVDESLAKHINFARINDTASAVSKGDSVWLNHTAYMTAYFKGCKYYSDTLALKVAYDNIVIYDGGFNSGGNILDLSVTPNPFDNYSQFEDVRVTATFSEATDAELFLYHMSGKLSASYKINARLGEWKKSDGEASFTVKLSEFEGIETWKENGEYSIPEVMVLLLKTKNDAEGTHIIYRP